MICGCKVQKAKNAHGMMYFTARIKQCSMHAAEKEMYNFIVTANYYDRPSIEEAQHIVSIVEGRHE